ncbi:MAG: aldo/keto reductase [Acidobacteria bacterium]|nr:aldo/keto reductase [Acidobacteriota bacterium]
MDLSTTLGRTGLPVFRLGLTGAYWPGEAALRAGIDAGMNYIFWYYWDRQMTRVLHEVLPANREKFVIATGVSNLGNWAVRRGIESCRRRLRTDYLDVFHIFWVGEGKLKSETLDLLRRYKEEGKIRQIAISTHVRRYAGELIRQGVLDVVMCRYNAAHRGAEQEIFPYLPLSEPGVVSYTATRWGRLLRAPRGWSGQVPTAGECYRFVLSNPNVHVCLTAPRNARELEENLAAVAKGPLPPDAIEFMRPFGDFVHRRWW